MLLGVSIAAGGLIYPQAVSLLAVRDTLIECAKECARCEQAAARVEHYENKQKETVEKLLSTYGSLLPSAERMPHLVSAIKQANDQARVRGLTIATHPPEALPEDDAASICIQEDGGKLSSRRIPMILSGESTYRQLAVFLRELAAAPRLVTVKSISIRRREERSHRILFEAEANAFCFLPLKEREH
jgi:Tfp pilus assembly protein PilO